MSTERLIPKPHMIKSVRARRWDLPGALQELVDNAIGHGHARSVVIAIDNLDHISVSDDGVGVKDINSIFWYGDSTSYADLSEIGQYGVGAFHAIIWLGDVTTVRTIRDGRRYSMTVDWAALDRAGQWPERYDGKGFPVKAGECGTQVVIKKLARHYSHVTSDKMARDFGQIFAPGLRRGVHITIKHRLADGRQQELPVAPYTPADLTKETSISGEIGTRSGVLRWSGRAGLSASLIERFNAVHVAFGHRVIEVMRDPFKGKSVPTVYVEVQLDETTPWKHQLSEHKDQVVKYRDELVEAIHQQIKELLEESEQQSKTLALAAMIAPIENELNRNLKRAGLLFVNPEEEEEIIISDDGIIDPDPDPDPGPMPPLPGDTEKVSLDVEGDPAGPTNKPTGIHFDWRTREQLEGNAWYYEIRGPLMVILLDEEMFSNVIKWPPGERDYHIMHTFVGFVSYAIEREYLENEERVRRVITPKLAGQLGAWATERNGIAPLLYRELLPGSGLPTPRPKGRPPKKEERKQAA